MLEIVRSSLRRAATRGKPSGSEGPQKAGLTVVTNVKGTG